MHRNIQNRVYGEHVIGNKRDFYNHMKYTLYNYCKHELPEDWKYTGLKYREMLDEFDG